MNQTNYKYRVGELRPSQILFTYGVGAVADLPNLSVMVMGLEDWDNTRGIELSEERLLAAVRRELGLQVKQLLSPPIPSDAPASFSPLDNLSKIGIPVAPFPAWMVCPKCRLLAPIQAGFFELKPNPYRIDRTCYVHKNCPKTIKPPAVIAARFLVACEKGHLDDFPWLYFVHGGNTNCFGPLRLEEFGVSGAATDIVVSCDSCNASRRLSDAFGESGKKNMPGCRARHPHLRSFDADCDKQMKGMLLGASNSWFSIALSVLSIPAASGQLEQLVEQYWTVLGKATNLETLQVMLSAMQSIGQLQDLAKYSIDDIWSIIEQKQTGTEASSYQDLKTPEWEVFSAANPANNTKEFQLRPVAVPPGYSPYFSQVVLVERLREVRALIGFTRIQSPGDFADVGEVPLEYRVQISRHAPQWVPTTEVRGEGIFIQFKESVIQEWAERPELVKRNHFCREAHKNWLNSRNIDPDKIKFPGLRYVLLHSFAHALMRQLAIECGYNSASLRERIYSRLPEDEFGPMAGVLIYTASADSEGTLGGLVNLGQPVSLAYHISQALEQMRLCSSDPLCASHEPTQGAAALHWATCHACLFSPETSCERGNKYLDRALLVRTIAIPHLAFFQ